MGVGNPLDSLGIPGDEYMSARLMILVVAAGTLAVAFAVRSSSPPYQGVRVEADQELAGDVGRSVHDYRVLQTPLSKRPLAGREPENEPEFLINVSVDPTGRKNRAYIDISEVHGYYVETFKLGLMYKATETESIQLIEHFVDRYLPADDTLRICVDLVPLELNKVGGIMGHDEDWDAVVLSHGRVRETNPDPLPELAEAFDCD